MFGLHLYIASEKGVVKANTVAGIACIKARMKPRYNAKRPSHDAKKRLGKGAMARMLSVLFQAVGIQRKALH
jgi:hypothetical protein